MRHTRHIIDSARRVMAGIGIGLIVLAGLPTAYAQVVPLPTSVEPVAFTVAADDTDTWAIIRYVGPTTGTTTTQNSGTVEVEADTDMVFLSGAQGAEAADTSLECPVSGALGGIIDVDDAACNTAGEVCDIINAPTSNFRCILIGAMTTEVVNDRIVQTAATRATSAAGLSLKWDTSTAFDYTVAVTPWTSFSDYLASPANLRNIKPNKYDGTRTGLYSVNFTSTFGSGTSNLRFYSVKINPLSSTGKWTETVTTLNSMVGGATTVNQVFALPTIGIHARRNEKLIVKLDNSAAMSAVTGGAYGLIQRYAQ